MHLEHVNMTVSDLERSIDVYSRLLGLRVRWRGTTSSGTPAAHVGDDDWYLAFFEATNRDRAEVDYETVGLNHVGFVVDDLEAAKGRLGSLGLEPHAEQEYDPGKRLYFFDPDGIEVELVEYAPAERAAGV